MNRDRHTVVNDLAEIEDIARAMRNAERADSKDRQILSLITNLAKIVREDIVK